MSKSSSPKLMKPRIFSVNCTEAGSSLGGGGVFVTVVAGSSSAWWADSGAVTLGPFISSRIVSAKRSASPAIVRLGLGPTGPGMTDPSAMCSPG